jgi:hypothetical protein
MIKFKAMLLTELEALELGLLCLGEAQLGDTDLLLGVLCPWGLVPLCNKSTPGLFGRSALLLPMMATGGGSTGDVTSPSRGRTAS